MQGIQLPNGCYTITFPGEPPFQITAEPWGFRTVVGPVHKIDDPEFGVLYVAAQTAVFSFLLPDAVTRTHVGPPPTTAVGTWANC